MFADYNTDLYNTFLTSCVKGSGKDNSDYILNNFTITESGTPLWYALQQLRANNSGELVGAYIPNVHEFIKICLKLATVPTEQGYLQYNSNASCLFIDNSNPTKSYWTSCQYNINKNFVSSVSINSALGGYGRKDGPTYSFTCIDFNSYIQ